MKYKSGEKITLTFELSSVKTENLLVGTPKSVRKVFDLLKKSNKPLKVNELQELSNLTDRTIRLALNTLYKLNLVSKVPNLEDFRSHFLIITTRLTEQVSSLNRNSISFKET